MTIGVPTVLEELLYVPVDEDDVRADTIDGAIERHRLVIVQRVRKVHRHQPAAKWILPQAEPVVLEPKDQRSVRDAPRDPRLEPVVRRCQPSGATHVHDAHRALDGDQAEQYYDSRPSQPAPIPEPYREPGHHEYGKRPDADHVVD